MRMNLEPPSFISGNKSYAQYEKDLKQWSRLTSLDKKLQAELVVYKLEDHESKIKEKITTQIGDQLEGKEDGIDVLLNFLKNIYDVDDMGDAHKKYVDFRGRTRKQGESVTQYITEWENLYHKAKNAGCALPDIVLCFELLAGAKLDQISEKLVLTGVDYTSGKTKKDLLEQMKKALRKYFSSDGSTAEMDSQVQQTLISSQLTTELETALVADGWTKPTRKKRKYVTAETGKRQNYRDRHTGKIAKCWNCKCNHEDDCKCECTFHLADKCPSKERKKKGENRKDKTDTNQSQPQNELGLYMTTWEDEDVEPSEEFCFLSTCDQEVCLLSQNNFQRALIDCACPTTVSGLTWLKNFIANMPTPHKEKISVWKSSKVYKFGDGGIKQSKYTVLLPVNIAGMDVFLKTEVIDSTLPLLIGNTTLRAADAVLYINKKKIQFIGSMEDMNLESSGHFSIEIKQPVGMSFVKKENVSVTLMVNQEKVLSEKEIWKLHHYFGHKPPDVLEKVIRSAGKYNDEVKNNLEKLKECEGCKLEEDNRPKPKVALQKAVRVNQLVALDLKEWKTGDFEYILYMVDVFSRLAMAVFLKNKEAKTVTEALVKCWIGHPGLGPMEGLFNDRGSEFENQEMSKLCEYLQVRHISTPAYSPNCNGLNERNHAVIDKCVRKMIILEPGICPQIALAWSINAHNTLRNIKGFTPAQIAFGRNPKIPSIYSDTPASMEEVEMSKQVSDHLHGMILSREMFIQAEADQTIKNALKQRFFKTSGEIKKGDWICYKNARRWEGPVKVHSSDGKLIYAVKGNRLLTINSDNIKMVRHEEEFLGLKGRGIENNDNEEQRRDDQGLRRESCMDFQQKQDIGNGAGNSRAVLSPSTKNDPNRTVPMGGLRNNQNNITPLERSHTIRSSGDTIASIPNPENNSSQTQSDVREESVSLQEENHCNLSLQEESHCNSSLQEESHCNLPLQEESHCNLSQQEKTHRKLSHHEKTHRNLSHPEKAHRNLSEPEDSEQNNPQILNDDIIVTAQDDSESGLAEGNQKEFVEEYEVIPCTAIKKKDQIRFRVRDEEEWIIGKIVSRAGKVGQKYDKWWNIADNSTGHVKPMDTSSFTCLERKKDNQNLVNEVLVINVPRWRHREPQCIDAKNAELEKFDKFDVYTEVKDVGQKYLLTNWVLTEKWQDEEKIIKARLTIRGDMEETENIRKDSPTVRKDNIRLLLTVAAKEGWRLDSDDVQSAFLQTAPIEREVYVLPPKEKRIPGILWKLKKTVYGLADASRGFHLSFSQKLEELGATKSLLDPALFIQHKPGSRKGDKVRWPSGIAETHVDDVINGGDKNFKKSVMKPLLKAFKFGDHEERTFRYVGWNMNQEEEGIYVDQDHYIESLEEIDMSVADGIAMNELLGENGQTEYRSAVGKLLMIGYSSRPDICFDAKIMSSKYGKATRTDLRKVNKRYTAVKMEGNTKMVVPNIGNIEDWILLGHGDASVNKNMPENLRSIGGRVILLWNWKTNKAVVLHWKSKKLKRKVVSSLAGEVYAMQDTIGQLVYTKALLSEIYGTRMKDIKTIVVTDCLDLEKAVLGTKLVENAWIVEDVAIIKEALANGDVSSIARVSSHRMLANCLTKSGTSSDELMQIIRTGSYEPPKGWLDSMKL